MPATHEITHICDDVRNEVGNKLRLMGLYDRGVVVDRIPARLPKLCFFQRWLEASEISTVRIELRGTALAATYVSTGSVDKSKQETGYRKLQISLTFAPVEFNRDGAFEFATYINDEAQPRHIHEMNLEVREAPES